MSSSEEVSSGNGTRTAVAGHNIYKSLVFGLLFGFGGAWFPRTPKIESQSLRVDDPGVYSFEYIFNDDPTNLEDGCVLGAPS
jgi:hypothetical protein